ncbi:hypothetical protein SAMN02787118_15210 [Streptomyces mirabilis]|jgi:hypothetical protein|uniref:Transposase n=1 Tax=Streptomyces mirabilis TaxID=68239 RepID=A0A1I2XVP5_9ACTN|nr:hypothetical protein SAMN02787118_15210 [Streptomyces mirabilis]
MTAAHAKRLAGLGIASSTAHRWARFAQDSWADYYLAACQATE